MSTIFKKILLVYDLVPAPDMSLSALIFSNGHSISNAISALKLFAATMERGK